MLRATVSPAMSKVKSPIVQVAPHITRETHVRFFFYVSQTVRDVKFWLYDYREDADYCKGFSFIGMSLG